MKSITAEIQELAFDIKVLNHRILMGVANSKDVTKCIKAVSMKASKIHALMGALL